MCSLHSSCYSTECNKAFHTLLILLCKIIQNDSDTNNFSFRSTVALICVLCLCICWHYVLKLKHIQFGDVVLAETYKLWFMATVSFIVLLLCAGHVLLWILIFTLLPVLTHAALHVPMHIEPNKKDDDIDPEDPGDDPEVVEPPTEGDQNGESNEMKSPARLG